TTIQDQMRLDQRAWIGVVDVVTDGGTETTDTFRAENVQIVIHNSGKTPALKMSGQCCIFSSYIWSDPIPDYDGEVAKGKESEAKLRKQTEERMAETIK